MPRTAQKLFRSKLKSKSRPYCLSSDAVAYRCQYWAACLGSNVQVRGAEEDDAGEK